jgi:hypothetical protein
MVNSMLQAVRRIKADVATSRPHAPVGIAQRVAHGLTMSYTRSTSADAMGPTMPSAILFIT